MNTNEKNEKTLLTYINILIKKRLCLLKYNGELPYVSDSKTYVSCAFWFVTMNII